MELNLTGNHEVVGLNLGLALWVGDLVLPWAVVWVTDASWILHCCGCGVGQKLLTPIQPLTWEPPYATGVALKIKKKKKKKKKAVRLKSVKLNHLAIFHGRSLRANMFCQDHVDCLNALTALLFYTDGPGQ